MPENYGGRRPEQYEDPVGPTNPPQAAAGPATVVAGMWYYLGPIGLIVVVVLMALFYWGRDDSRDDAVEPTTGISDEKTPGGGNPAPEPDSTKDESESKGGR
jgi:hypothetical protein